VRIRIIDTETTGVEPTDHVVEVAAWDLIPDQGPVGILNFDSRFVKPPIPIPPLASAVHHIIDDDVVLAQSWAVTWPLFVDDRVDAYAAHNAKFDRMWFTDAIVNGKPFICSYRCALRIWPGLQSHSNQGLRYQLKPEGLDRSIASAAAPGERRRLCNSPPRPRATEARDHRATDRMVEPAGASAARDVRQAPRSIVEGRASGLFRVVLPPSGHERGREIYRSSPPQQRGRVVSIERIEIKNRGQWLGP